MSIAWARSASPCPPSRYRAPRTHQPSAKRLQRQVLVPLLPPRLSLCFRLVVVLVVMGIVEADWRGLLVDALRLVVVDAHWLGVVDAHWRGVHVVVVAHWLVAVVFAHWRRQHPSVRWWVGWLALQQRHDDD